MQAVFVKIEQCTTTRLPLEIHRGGNSRLHQSFDLLLIVSHFLLSLFYSNNSSEAERHIMTELVVMMGSGMDYNPTRFN